MTGTTSLDPMTLQFLIFDASDNGDDTGSWEAMASVREADLHQVMAEVDAVMAWANQRSPGPRGPLDESGVWDADLHQQADGGDGWIGVTFTLTGPWAWGEALIAHFTASD